MRLFAALAVAAGVAVAAPALAQQSLLGNTAQTPDTAPQPLMQSLGPPVAVPPPPPIAPAAPAAPAPQVINAPPPPGLVQTPAPPANVDNGATPPADDAQTGTSAPNPAQPDAAQPNAGQPDAAAPPVANAPAQVPSTADSTPPPPANDWVPQKTAALGILDKVDGSTAAVAIPVGGQSTVGDLLVNVLACFSRPAGEIPDNAIFVSIQPVTASDGGPIFRGWMLRSIPGATVVGDASETFRVEGCS